MNHKEGYQGFSMTYTPNTPANGAENIAISQPKITTNFQQLNTIFDADHYTWNFATSSQRGLHRQITFPAPLVADPSTSTLKGSFYTKEDVNDTSARPQLYFQNINGVNAVQQITNRFKDASTEGYWMLSNGSLNNPSLIIMWGTITGLSSGTAITQNFHTIANYVGGPSGFPNNCFNVQLTLANQDNSTSPSKTATVYSISKTRFKYNLNSSANDAIYWFAIGN
jgi:hypothetical protein